MYLPRFMNGLHHEPGYPGERPSLVLDLASSVPWDRKSARGASEDLATTLAPNTGPKALVVRGHLDPGPNDDLSR